MDVTARRRLGVGVGGVRQFRRGRLISAPDSLGDKVVPDFTCIVYGRTRDILSVEILHGADVTVVAEKALRMVRDIPDAQHCDLWQDNRKLATYFTSGEGRTGQPT